MRLATATISLGLAIAALCGAARASSPDAWAEFDARARKACIQASGIRDGRPSPIVGFDDRVGMVAMLVSGAKRGGAAPKLCLYDKRARKAFVDEAAGWSAPSPQR